MKLVNRKSQVAEVANLAASIITAYQSNRVEDNTISQIIIDLGKYESQITSAIQRSKTNSNLLELDAVRDAAWVDLYYLVFGFTHSPLENMRSAASRLFKVIDKYGLKLAKANYASESALLKSVFDEIETGNMREQMAELPSVSEAYENLIVSEEKFHNERIRYQQANAEESVLVVASEIKKDIIDLINDKLVKYLDAMLMVQPDRYEKLYRVVSEIIETNNLRVSKR